MYPDRLSEILEGQRRQTRKITRQEQGNPTFLPIFLTGGIGDGILLGPTLERLRELGFVLLVYSKHAGSLRYFYKDMRINQGELPDFTWSLRLDSVATFKFQNQFSGFSINEHRELFEKQQERFRKDPELEYLVRKHPSQKALLAQKAVELGQTVVTLPLYSLGFETSIRRTPPYRVQKPECYITIHDGFDVQNKATVSGRCTKQWDWGHWNELVKALRCHFPNLDVIQLGSKTSRILDGTTQNLVNKTTLHEAFDVLAKSALHIDTDSGLVHAATALGVPCVVLFGPTPHAFYGHPQNINLSSTKSCSGGCFHLNNSARGGWMDKCPIGYPTPQCLDDISPQTVLDAAVRARAPKPHCIGGSFAATRDAFTP